jgi:hypothetical protein
MFNPLPPLLKVLLHGLTGCVFQRAFKFPEYTRNRSPLKGGKKKIITIKLKKTE